MAIGIVGTGYVGLVLGLYLAKQGYAVTCVDIDQSKIEMLNRGVSPLRDDGVQEALTEQLQHQRIQFTTSYEDARDCDPVFFCIGTPAGDNGVMDVASLWNAVRSWQEVLVGPSSSMDAVDEHTIVIRSTVPVGTIEAIHLWLRQKEVDAEVYHWPEFLSEGTAWSNMQEPDRIIVGGESLPETGSEWQQILRSFDRPILHTTPVNSELTKLASNAYLAARLSFIHEVAQLAEYAGGDIEVVTRGMGLDPRIGQAYLQAGIGFGGPCLEKDTQTLLSQLQEATKADTPLITQSVLERNELQQEWAIEEVSSWIEQERAQVIAVWGVTFKGGTSDVTNSPALKVVERLIQLHPMSTLRLYDPAYESEEEQQRLTKAHPALSRITWAQSADEAVEQADLLLVLTDWKTFKAANLYSVGRLLKHKRIFDGRNLYPPEELAALGYSFKRVGYGGSSGRAPKNT